jgi:hypothetical protein
MSAFDEQLESAEREKTVEQEGLSDNQLQEAKQDEMKETKQEEMKATKQEEMKATKQEEMKETKQEEMKETNQEEIRQDEAKIPETFVEKSAEREWRRRGVTWS